MINLTYDKIEDGFEFCWVTWIEFSQKTFRIIRNQPPAKLKVKNLRLESGYKKFDLVLEDGSLFECNASISDVDTLYMPSFSYCWEHLYQTKEEAYEFYNGLLQDQIDKLDSFYQEKKKYLLKKFIKI